MMTKTAVFFSQFIPLTEHRTRYLLKTMNQPLSPQDIELMNKGLDALIAYMDSIAEEKFDTISEVFHRVVEAQRELKDLGMDEDRRYLETCFKINF